MRGGGSTTFYGFGSGLADDAAPIRPGAAGGVGDTKDFRGSYAPVTGFKQPGCGKHVGVGAGSSGGGGEDSGPDAFGL